MYYVLKCVALVFEILEDMESERIVELNPPTFISDESSTSLVSHEVTGTVPGSRAYGEMCYRNETSTDDYGTVVFLATHLLILLRQFFCW